MKINVTNPFLLTALLAGFGLVPGYKLSAVSLSALHSFSVVAPDSSGNATNSDGANPYTGLSSSGNNLYGTAGYGGISGNGTVFTVNTDGSGFRNVYSFTGQDSGAHPTGTLILSGITLYGLTSSGGTSGNGTVFKVNVDGTGFLSLHSFPSTSGPLYTNADGAQPSSLVLSGSNLYGTAMKGGAGGSGTIFKLNTDGSSFSVLYDFTAAFPDITGGNTNSDGFQPNGLLSAGTALYGTARVGGNFGNGTLFAINTDGTSFAILHTFTATDDNDLNQDGVSPGSGFVLSGNTLYGTTTLGGTWAIGTVFAVSTDGARFSTLHNFTGGDCCNYVNAEGAYPKGNLTLSGNSLYGTAANGGSAGNGTIFGINTDGTGFTNYYSFSPPNAYGLYLNGDGTAPNGGLVVSGDSAYGTATSGGPSGEGTVFKLSFGATSGGPPPQLKIIASSGNVILNWPMSATSFTLQSTPNLGPQANWAPVSTPPVIVNGQNTVTTPASSQQQFYRLIQ